MNREKNKLLNSTKLNSTVAIKKMKPEFALKFFTNSLNNKKNPEKGFTLIELLVVVIIVGILAAVALPNLLRQIGRARETELKNTVGISLRQLQDFHSEQQEFTDDIDDLGIQVDAQYIDNLPDNTAPTATATAFITFTNQDPGFDFAVVSPENVQFADDGTRAYGGSIVHDLGEFYQVVCQTPQDAQILVLSDPTGSAEIQGIDDKETYCETTNNAFYVN